MSNRWRRSFTEQAKTNQTPCRSVHLPLNYLPLQRNSFESSLSRRNPRLDQFALGSQNKASRVSISKCELPLKYIGSLGARLSFPTNKKNPRIGNFHPSLVEVLDALNSPHSEDKHSILHARLRACETKSCFQRHPIARLLSQNPWVLSYVALEV